MADLTQANPNNVHAFYHFEGITDWDSVKEANRLWSWKYGKTTIVHFNHKNFEECNDKCLAYGPDGEVAISLSGS